LTRSPEDLVAGVADPEKGLTLEDILGIEPPVPPQPTVVFATEIYRRGARSVNMFRALNGDLTDPAVERLPTFDPATIPALDQPAPDSAAPAPQDAP
jgi:hypothetical protein